MSNDAEDGARRPAIVAPLCFTLAALAVFAFLFYWSERPLLSSLVAFLSIDANRLNQGNGPATLVSSEIVAPHKTDQYQETSLIIGHVGPTGRFWWQRELSVDHVKALALRHGTTRSAILREAVAKYVRRNPL